MFAVNGQLKPAKSSSSFCYHAGLYNIKILIPIGFNNFNNLGFSIKHLTFFKQLWL